jgi:hypothetical protein
MRKIYAIPQRKPGSKIVLWEERVVALEMWEDTFELCLWGQSWQYCCNLLRSR